MANLGNDMKLFFLKGMEALGKAASNITSSAQQKLNEINLENRLNDLKKEIPTLALQLWKNGAQMPDVLSVLLGEMSQLEEQLAAMRAKPEPAPEPAADEAAPSFEEAADSLEQSVDAAVDAAGDFVESKIEQVEDAVESMVDSLRKPEEEQPEEPARDDDPQA